MHRSWLGVVGAVLLSCSRLAPVADVEPTLDVVVGGCFAWVGEACERDGAQPLRLWVASASEPVLTPRSRWTVREKQARDDGWLVVVDGAVDVGEVELMVGRRRARLDVRPREPMAALENAETLRRDGELERAYALVQDHAGDSALEGARKAAIRARVELARRDLDRALTSLRDAESRYTALHRGAEAADQRFTMAYVQLHDLADARTALASVENGRASAGRSGRTRSLAAYYRGLVRSKMGDVRGALEDLEAARRLAHMMGDEALAKDVTQVEVQILPLLGRSPEAASQLNELLARPDLSGCARAMALNNLGWLGVLDELVGSPPNDQTLRNLDRAAGLFEGVCPDARERANVEVNRLIVASQRRSWREVRERLALLASMGPLDAEVRAWRDEVDARLTLAVGSPADAEAKYKALDERAQQQGHLPLRVLALQGVARSLERRGQRVAALSWYRDAEQTWRTASRQVPLGEGRGGFLERARPARQHYLGLLIELGRTREALEFARQIRVELVASVRWWDRVSRLPAAEQTAWFVALGDLRRDQDGLDRRAEQDWSLSASKQVIERASRARERAALAQRWESMLAGLGIVEEALPPAPRASGYAVVLVSRTDVGRVMFVASSRDVLALPAGDDDDDAWIERTVQQIGDAPGVVVLLEPDALALRLDARLRERLPSGVPVVYSMDLPAVDACRAPRLARALVVADPGQDLVYARLEGQAVAEAMAKGGVSVELVTGAYARTGLVRAKLESPGLDWFHYAGHAVRGDREGRASALVFADGTRLDVDELLTLQRVPPRVVLSACEGAAVEGETVLGLGVAQAFLLAGACEVVAGTRAVDDAAALHVMTELYAAPPTAPLSSRLHQAEHSVVASTTATDLFTIQR